MSAQAQFAPTRLETQRALHMGLGAAAAPTLWAAYFAAASAGVTYWWMTGAWSRRTAQPLLPEPKAFTPRVEPAKAEVVVEPKPEPKPEPFREPVDLIAIAEVAMEAAPAALEAAAPAEVVETAQAKIEAAVDADEAKPAPRKTKKSKA
jgi:hypothetical protein